MPEEMPKVEAEKSTEKPVSEYTFKEAFATRQRLTRQKETASSDALAKIEEEIVQVKGREDFLVGEVEQEGGLMGLDQDLGILKDMLDVGELSPSHLFDARRTAPQLDNLADVDPSDPHAGVREWYYRSKLDEILEQLKGAEKGSRLSSNQRGTSLETSMGNLIGKISDLIKTFEQSGQLRPALTPDQIAKMATQDALDMSGLRTDQLRRAFGRLAPEVEKDRWIDVEVDQEFYTRFSPNQEPYFYSESSRAERERWDARWTLARATFYKKMYGAMPDKLMENQDLISLTKEQMETLYNVEGVKEALMWYVDKIVNGGEITEVERELKVGKGRETIIEIKKVGIGFLGCEDGNEFKAIRRALRLHLLGTVFGDIKPDNREERRGLLMKIKSADAIAWNLVFCANLVESVDSRYSQYDGSEGRHDGLAPAVCSDDLRAVFHPQEKFEAKCRNGLEWGGFGKWGQTQMERIMQPFKDEMKKKEEQEEKERDKARNEGTERVPNFFKNEYLFRGASSLNNFWTVARDRITEEVEEVKKDNEVISRIYTKKIPINAPECYPTTSLRSFFEEYDLVEQLLKGEVDWHNMNADLWKTSYLTVRLRKAVGLAEYFAGKNPFDPKKEKEWVISLLDIYRRLGFERKLSETQFHNLKVWAFYASMGGMTRPHHKEVTPPLVGTFSKAGLVDMAARFRNPYLGYLKRGIFGETLEIKD